jgi:hypothetical protein
MASSAAKEASSGKLENEVLAARTRISRVATWMAMKAAGLPSTCWASWATRVGLPSANGRASKRVARKVIPTNRNAMMVAM